MRKIRRTRKMRRIRRGSHSKRKVLIILSIITLLILCVIVAFKLNTKDIEDYNYKNEDINISSEDKVIINKVIDIAKEKVGFEYVWGGKGEVMTTERLDELINYYGESYYPLKKEAYIGKQAFDCSGLTYWLYKEVTGVEIGYSTVDQEKILAKYKVDKEELQSGDLIFTPGHVVMYIGKGKMINANNKYMYPVGGVKESTLYLDEESVIYRPIDYIKDNNK